MARWIRQNLVAVLLLALVALMTGLLTFGIKKSTANEEKIIALEKEDVEQSAFRENTKETLARLEKKIDKLDDYLRNGRK